ncbi:DUF3841 domain-containing protein [Paralysiella testudinis]|uniref:DUF3841 domain-containing protein n=1 Tax=Paralysiella testudinis TaxID=2809020 RepID=A0A892ZIJ3_9NEIS|nr:DUF3841 domain-containing protein [Paralysiella testudinis]QRQ81657.1 DUF3841 domain-containing protein [Paralysiella testudinis]
MLIKLWTVRPASDYALLQQQGFYSADSRYVLPERAAAYRWMAQQLAEKTPTPAGVDFPLWAWCRAHGSRQPKPDLRKRDHLEKGQPGVCIEFMLPQAQVLLSSFDGWHAVLNNHFFSLGDEEYEYHESLQTRLPPAALAREKQKSWLRIFDLDLLPEPAVYEVQAVFWRLELASVVKVDYFVAR